MPINSYVVYWKHKSHCLSSHDISIITCICNHIVIVLTVVIIFVINCFRKKQLLVTGMRGCNVFSSENAHDISEHGTRIICSQEVCDVGFDVVVLFGYSQNLSLREDGDTNRGGCSGYDNTSRTKALTIIRYVKIYDSHVADGPAELWRAASRYYLLLMCACMAEKRFAGLLQLPSFSPTE